MYTCNMALQSFPIKRSRWNIKLVQLPGSKVFPIDQFVFNLEDRMNNRLLMSNIKTLLHFLISLGNEHKAKETLQSWRLHSRSISLAALLKIIMALSHFIPSRLIQHFRSRLLKEPWARSLKNSFKMNIDLFRNLLPLKVFYFLFKH